MSVLVTGAAGFIGSHVVEALLARGERVIGLDSFASNYSREDKEANLRPSLAHPRLEFVEADIRDEGLDALLSGGVQAIVHAAALAGVRPSVEDPVRYADVNVTGTVRLLEFARARRIAAFVFASSSSVYGDTAPVPFRENDAADRPISPYAASKRAGELFCHAATHLHGITTVCLRLFTVYGPRQRPDLAIRRFTRLVSEGRAIPLFGDGSSSRDYTFVGDIVAGIVGALEWARANPGRHEVVNLGGTHAVTLDELVATLGESMGAEPMIERLPSQPGDVRRTSADIEKAASLFGFRPETVLEEGIARFLEWFDARNSPCDSGDTPPSG